MLSIAIQAGGGSRRMGQNKALMPFLGRPLIERVIARLQPLADELFITANEPELFSFLGIPVYPDIQPGQGALGGMLTALRHARHPAVAVVACDMPFASPQLLQYQHQVMVGKKVDLVVPLTALGPESLHAVYQKMACLPAIETALATGKLKLSGWFEQVNIHRLAIDEWERFDPDHIIFTNLNTPDEFLKAEQYAKTHPA